MLRTQSANGLFDGGGAVATAGGMVPPSDLVSSSRFSGPIFIPRIYPADGGCAQVRKCSGLASTHHSEHLLWAVTLFPPGVTVIPQVLALLLR